jgi:hypothetical protein
MGELVSDQLVAAGCAWRVLAVSKRDMTSCCVSFGTYRPRRFRRAIVSVYSHLAEIVA